jgi:azurin
LEVSSVGEEQKFDTGEMSACEGTQVTVKYINSSTTLQHNWVLVNKGAKDDVALRGTLFATANWIEPSDTHIVNSTHTALLEPGEAEEISFTAPSAGTYQFVCTFPGHSATMFGDFVVTPGGAGTSAAPTTAAATPTSAPAGPITLEISSVGEEQRFDKDTLTATQGAQVTLKFDNVSTTLQHNWILVKAGAKDDVATRGTLFPTGDWIDPNDADIIDAAHTKLLASGGVEEISFTAPPAGTYQFVCTFPGHNATMFGDFVVSN